MSTLLPSRRTAIARAACGAIALLFALTACGAPADSEGANAETAKPVEAGAELVRVPADAPTIGKALKAVASGGLVLVSPGTYTESVTIDKPDVTLRGLDRNEVIIDGEGLRANGVQVIADGVRVENLTVRNHTFNGVLVTGMHDENGAQAHNLTGYDTLDPEKYPPLQRFAVNHVTASNNGLYGIYAFNSQHGTITSNYASGSADSGIYVGQCANCDILVSDNVAENNAIGYENANASDSVVVASNRFSNNRVGLTLISWYLEAYLPQKSAIVVGNVISDNNSPLSPAQASGAFGIGIGLSGAQSNVIKRNLISGNSVAGVQLANTEDLAAADNQLLDNALGGNGVDVADVSAARTPSSGTCVSPATAVSIAPLALSSSFATACGSDVAPPSGWIPGTLPTVVPPAGISFLQVAPGRPQPQLAGALDVIPDPLPAFITMPAHSFIVLPDAGMLTDRTRF